MCCFVYQLKCTQNDAASKRNFLDVTGYRNADRKAMKIVSKNGNKCE